MNEQICNRCLMCDAVAKWRTLEIRETEEKVRSDVIPYSHKTFFIFVILHKKVKKDLREIP